MKNDLWLSLGSNIEPREYYLKTALKSLSVFFEPIRISSLYETAPVDDTDQAEFYNLCAYYQTEIQRPEEILKIIKTLETHLGRVKDPVRPKGPRVIDIDILFLGKTCMVSSELIIPHPRMFERKFVLMPLVEILPERSFFLEKYGIIKCLTALDGQQVTRIGALTFE